MIIPDVNIMVYAHNSGVPEHEATRTWWEKTVNGAEPIGIDWSVALGFIRLMSSPRVAVRPVRPEQLLRRVSALLEAPSVRIVTPGARHVAIMRELFEQSGAGSRSTIDVHLAALAIELGAILATNNTDFARFTRLKTVNPVG